MSKTSETKNKILKMLAAKEMRLVDMHSRLHLATPTIIQHLKELERMGLIKKVDDQHFKNIKHYALNRNVDSDANTFTKVTTPGDKSRQQNTSPRLIVLPLTIMLVFIGVALFTYFINLHEQAHVQQTPQKQGGGALELLFTDPANVPYGTQNLTMTYTPMYVHVNDTTGNRWIKINSGGMMQPMRLFNISQPIGYIQLPSDAHASAVTFNISMATITLNGITYPVELPDGKVNISLKNCIITSNETFGVLLDMSPTVFKLNRSNSTAFAMTYSIRTIMMKNMSNFSGR